MSRIKSILMTGLCIGGLSLMSGASSADSASGASVASEGLVQVRAIDRIRQGEGRQFTVEMNGYIPPTRWLPRILGGKAVISATVGPDTYQINSRVRAAGIVDWFIDYSSTLESTGAVTKDGVQPRYYVASDDEGRKNRRTRIIHNGDQVDVDVVPEYGFLGDPAPTMEQKAEAMDPLSALLSLAVNPNADPDNPCEGTVRIFDGKGRYNLHLSPGPYIEALEDTAWNGPAFVCNVSYEEVAGYKKKTPAERQEEIADIKWLNMVLADLGPGEVRVPIKIEARSKKRGKVTIEARKFSYGPLNLDQAQIELESGKVAPRG